MPVATTVTQTWPVRRSSIVAPKMMFVSSVAAPRITSAASFTSISVMSSPPAIESRMPVAPVISSSISGERSARSAASLARLSWPDEKPIPISAVPESLMIVRTSAKSRLIRPGIVIRSQIPCTPWRRTSSATLNASSIEVDLSSTSSRRSFGMTIVVSQAARSCATPVSACVRRFVPSNLNGVVTIPTVSAPRSRAIFATTGAAPEPVPPPSPAATNTMSEPRSACFSWS